MTRQDVYVLIDEEREYQNKKWGSLYNDGQWSVGDWIIFIERYLKQAKDHIGNIEALDAVRKVAALAVACMEHNETPPRSEK